MSYVRIPAERFQRWVEVLRCVEEYSRRLRERLGKVAVILHGSYARGDFNLWSDVDLIIVSEAFRGVRPLDRYDLLPKQPPLVEPILLTPSEFLGKLRKRSWVQMLGRGAVIVADDYGLREELSRVGIEARTLEEALRRVHELRAKYSK